MLFLSGGLFTRNRHYFCYFRVFAKELMRRSPCCCCLPAPPHPAAPRHPRVVPALWLLFFYAFSYLVLLTWTAPLGLSSWELPVHRDLLLACTQVSLSDTYYCLNMSTPSGSVSGHDPYFQMSIWSGFVATSPPPMKGVPLRPSPHTLGSTAIQTSFLDSMLTQ